MGEMIRVEYMPFMVPIAIVATIFVTGMIKSIINTNAREESRRRIAKYVSEGKLTVIDAERLMRAEPKSWEKAIKDE